MKIIVKTCKGREHFVEYVKNKIPHVIVVQDRGGGAMECFLDALWTAGDEPAIHLEDDILITDNFEQKILDVIETYPMYVCQFFSMRKKDLTVGSRFEPGRTYLMNQCVYLPKGYSKQIYDYYAHWPNKEKHPTGCDTIIADFLRENKLKYYLHVPNLVDHRISRSMINPKRSTRRTSFTFEP